MSVTVLDATADAAAVRRALQDLAVASEGKTRRTWAVVGPVPGADRMHHMDLGRFLVRLDISQLLVVGDLAGSMHAGAVLEGSWGEESVHVDDAAAAEALLDGRGPDDVVLVAPGGDAALAELGQRLADT